MLLNLDTPSVTGLTLTVGVGVNNLRWDAALLPVKILAHTSNNRASATELVITSDNSYTHSFSNTSTSWYYWVETLNKDQTTTGVFNPSSPTGGLYANPNTALLAGTAASTVVSNAANGNSAFSGTASYRTTGAPSNNPSPSGITITANSNGSRDITLTWSAYTQGARKADMLILFWTMSGAAPTINDSGVSFNVNTAISSYYVFTGVDPSKTMSFGIAAARRTENGLEIGTIVTPTSSPDWLGVTSATPNYTGNLDGTATATVVSSASNALITATTALSNVNDMSADNRLTPVEKLVLRREWDALYEAHNSLLTKATVVSVDTTVLNNRFVILSSYLRNGSTSGWPGGVPTYISDGQLSNTTTLTNMNTLLRSYWKDYVDEMAAIEYEVNTKNVNPGSPLSSGNIIDLVDSYGISNYDTYKASSSVTGNGTWQNLATCYINRTDNVNPGVLHWFLSFAFTLATPTAIDIRVTKYKDGIPVASMGNGTFGNMGFTTITAAGMQQLVGGLSIDDNAVVGDVVYNIQWNSGSDNSVGATALAGVVRR